MARDPRYDILFEPVRIGPLTAKNRFYQPPHCNGMGEFRPHMHAAMRATKAEGGWAVVSLAGRCLATMLLRIDASLVAAGFVLDAARRDFECLGCTGQCTVMQ